MLRNRFSGVARDRKVVSTFSFLQRNVNQNMGVKYNRQLHERDKNRRKQELAPVRRQIGQTRKPRTNVLATRKIIDELFKSPQKNLIKSPLEQLANVVVAADVEPLTETDDSNIGEEIAGKINQADINSALKAFKMDKSVQNLAKNNNITDTVYDTCINSFHRFCLQSTQLPVELHIVLMDVIAKSGHVTDIFPFFLKHSHMVYPHLDCMDELIKISDLTDPSNWYPLARSMDRKIIFHAGPTNSGKTYHAMKSFMGSESGVYCGPLRLLAMEIYDKCKTMGVPCDLVTGETRMYANEDKSPASHISCTIEMMNSNQEYDVAIIDEIQMLGDIQRGSSWTRALLGIAAKEVHVCGEETAIPLVEKLLCFTNDQIEVRRYERLTSLTYLTQAVGGFSNVRAGDCIVCFSKRTVFSTVAVLTALGHNVAVIYGNLPPGTKISQSRRFNDPNDPCNILVATDAVGMGLNLAIKRVIFYALEKPTLRMDNTKVMDLLSTSQAQQISGRAGRYNTQYEHGEVTTFFQKDQKNLHAIVNTPKEPLQKAGLNATLEMIEMFSYHLPSATLANLMEIFTAVCSYDDQYFICNTGNFTDIANLIEDLPIPLNVKYTMCSVPLKVTKGVAQVSFRKMAKKFSQGKPLTYNWLYKVLGAPFKIPQKIPELQILEGAFEVVDIYLWLSYRYPDMYLEVEKVQTMRVHLDSVIQKFLVQMKVEKPSRSSANIMQPLLGKGKQSKTLKSTDFLEIEPTSKATAMYSGTQMQHTQSFDSEDETDDSAFVTTNDESDVNQEASDIDKGDEATDKVISFWSTEETLQSLTHDSLLDNVNEADTSNFEAGNHESLQSDYLNDEILIVPSGKTTEMEAASDILVDNAEQILDSDTDSTELQASSEELHVNSFFSDNQQDKDVFHTLETVRMEPINIDSVHMSRTAMESQSETNNAPETTTLNDFTSITEGYADETSNFASMFNSANQQQEFEVDDKSLKSNENKDEANKMESQSETNNAPETTTLNDFTSITVGYAGETSNFASMFNSANQQQEFEVQASSNDTRISSNYGKLTARLIEDGIISRALLDRLQLEWQELQKEKDALKKDNQTSIS